MENNVLILLSTFNGEKYLGAQLDSILAQYFPHWQLLIRDDGSSDHTTAIIREYTKKDPRIIFIEDALGNLNVIQSFSVLMQHALSRHENVIFFCDQDDVWLPNKLQLQLELFAKETQQYGQDFPILIHSDLRIVDHHLNAIHASYLQYEKITRNSHSPLKTLLINNFITGCTMGINKALLKMATPIPANVRMHDWWIGLCAAALGKIAFLDQATVLYRQHSQNTIGSKGFYSRVLTVLTKKEREKRKNNFNLCFAQASELLKLLHQNNHHYHLIQQFADLPSQHLLSRLQRAYQVKLEHSHYIRKIIFWTMLPFIG
jgi:glycosyltransferase involved in cell wall biosynthesis